VVVVGIAVVVADVLGTSVVDGASEVTVHAASPLPPSSTVTTALEARRR